ncbi:MAG: hypothetical protein ABIW76_20250 [Fibrobacteria bacterium]
MRTLNHLIIPALLLASAAQGLELGIEDIKVSGYVDEGRFQLKDPEVDGELVSRMGAKWRIEKAFNENWSLLAKPHWMFWRNQATDRGLFHIAGIKFDADLQGAILYKSGFHRAKAGLYEFKYNPDSKNLGEYLLRSGAYPTILESAQGKDMMGLSNTKVMGTEYGQDFRLFRHTALLYLEQINVPVNDLSAAYLAAVGPERAEAELGVSFYRFFKTGTPMKDDLVPQQMQDYIRDQGLTTKALKFSLRARMDISAFLEMESPCKIYGEAALLGLKNDTLFYRKTIQRVPVMMGAEIPTFGILNAFSVEAEYFQNPYLDKKYPMQDATGSKFSPLPYIPSYSDVPNFTQDDWKWSVYLHRALNRWIDLKVRIASDHLRLLDWESDYRPAPLTQRAQDWYLLARIEYHN